MNESLNNEGRSNGTDGEDSSAHSAGKDNLRASLDKTVYDSLRPVTLVLCVLYALFSVGHFFALPQPVLSILLPGAISTSLIYGALFILLGKKQFSIAWAHPFAFLIVSGALLNSALHMYLTGDIYQSTNFALVLIAVGCFFLAARWYASFVALTLFSWAAIALGISSPTDWSHFLFFMISASAVGMMAFIIRRKAHERLIKMNSDMLARNEALQTVNDKFVEGEQRYQHLVENAQDMVYTIDAKGCVTYVNPSARRFMDIGDNVLGRHYTRFIHRDYVDEVVDAIDEQVANQTPLIYQEFPAVTPEGAEIWVGQNVRLVMAGEEVVGFEGVVRNVSDRKRLEEDLRTEKDELERRVVERTQELERSYQELRKQTDERKRTEDQLLQLQKMEGISRLAGGVAHDFNNLLTVILCSCAFLHEELDADDPAMDLVDEIDEVAQRGASLTRHLLAFSRRQVLEPKVVKINDLLEDLHKVLDRLVGDTIELQLQLHPNLPNVRIDLGRFEQMIMNLAVNAQDAMPQGGRISIFTDALKTDRPLISFPEDIPPGDYVSVSLLDSGCGMDKETRSRSIEPFFTTKPRGKGTGLGLATVYGIAKQSEGYVSVESDPGEGTIVTLYLPATDEPADIIEDIGIIEDEVGGSETVLLVDDDEAICKAYAKLLRSKGYTVRVASGPMEALDIERELRDSINLLLTDVQMPRMNGDELARKITEQNPSIAVLFMSGFVEDQDLPPLLGDSPHLFLEKPFTNAKFLMMVRKALNTKASQPSV